MKAEYKAYTDVNFVSDNVGTQLNENQFIFCIQTCDAGMNLIRKKKKQNQIKITVFHNMISIMCVHMSRLVRESYIFILLILIFFRMDFYSFLFVVLLFYGFRNSLFNIIYTYYYNDCMISLLDSIFGHGKIYLKG